MAKAKAYLNIVLAVHKDKPFPCFAGAAIHSEPGETLTLESSFLATTALEITASSYQEAADIIRHAITVYPRLAWLRGWLLGDSVDKGALSDEVSRKLAEWKASPQLVYVDGNYVAWSKFLNDR